VDAEFESDALRAGLLRFDALARLRADADTGGGRTPAARIALPVAGVRLLVRPVRHGGWLGGWLGASLLGLARPLSELHTTDALRAAGAPVPRPALVVGLRRLGPIWNAAVGCVFVEGAQDLLAFLRGGPSPREIRRAAAAAGRAVRRFHDAGGRHADLHAGNLLLGQDPHGREVVTIVDLDRARRTPRVSPARRMAELMRLQRSLRKRGLEARVGPRGHASFLHAYVAGDRPLRQSLLRHLPRERARNRIHALAYGAARRARGSGEEPR
jgi:hypothetical protein